MKKLKILIFLAAVVSPIILFSQSSNHKWQRLSGRWEIKDSSAIENNGSSIQWKYNEILDYNTIISLIDFKGNPVITVKSKLFDRIESPSEFMISFAVANESKGWFYRMYAFKITGGFWGMDKVSFIHSDMIDKTKSLQTKNNTFVKELLTADCKVKYDTINNYRVAFEGTDVVLYINEEKIISAPFPEKLHDGRIAISTRNVKIAIDKVEVKQGEKVIFEDDFNENTIYVRTLNAVKENIPKTETDKKPQ